MSYCSNVLSLQVDSLKKAFSRQNIEKKMTKIGTKIVSQEQREKIKQRTSSLKVSPLTFGIRKVLSSLKVPLMFPSGYYFINCFHCDAMFPERTAVRSVQKAEQCVSYISLSITGLHYPP